MTTTIALEALSPASLLAQIIDMPHDTRAEIIATENGTEWARLRISPMTDSARSVFPLMPCGVTGDTRKAGESGVIVSPNVSTDMRRALSTVINRAARMSVKYAD
jgi:hypothetical protein